jgi:hypothetical protein
LVTVREGGLVADDVDAIDLPETGCAFQLGVGIALLSLLGRRGRDR